MQTYEKVIIVLFCVVIVVITFMGIKNQNKHYEGDVWFDNCGNICSHAYTISLANGSNAFCYAKVNDTFYACRLEEENYYLTVGEVKDYTSQELCFSTRTEATQ